MDWFDFKGFEAGNFRKSSLFGTILGKNKKALGFATKGFFCVAEAGLEPTTFGL